MNDASATIAPAEFISDVLNGWSDLTLSEKRIMVELAWAHAMVWHKAELPIDVAQQLAKLDLLAKMAGELCR